MKKFYHFTIALFGMVLVPSAVSAQCPAFFEDFNSSLGQFTASGGSNGNWVFASSCGQSSASGHSAPGSAMFQGSGCNFGNGGNTVSGDMVSPSIPIPPTGGTLSFNYYIQNECGTSGSCFYDQLYFDISTNGGTSFTNIANSDWMGGLSLGGWQAFTLNMSSYANQNVVLRFRFNSQDGVGNNYDGIYVDDVLVDVLCTYPNDAGLTSIDSPYVPACTIGNSVYVTLNNFGTQTLTSATINWSVNNIPMTPVSWTGSIASYTSGTSYFVGSHSFTSGDVLKVWTSAPNGQTDSLALNDTLTRTFVPSLNGTYTIGGVSSDYPTFSAAASDLNNFGICDTVIFLVSSGTYNEQFSLNDIVGASAMSPIYFKSVSGDSTSVTVTYTGTGSSDNYVARLNGTDHITFSGMTFANPGTYYGRVVTLQGANNNVTFHNMVLRSDTASWGWSDQQVVYAYGAIDSFLVIKDSRIRGGSQGIYLSSANQATPHVGLQLINNTIDKAYDSPIYLEHQRDVLVHQNTIRHNSSNSWGYYMYFWQNIGIEITENDILGSATGYGIYMDNSGGTNSNRALIANNFINMGDTTSWSDVYGMYSWQMSYTDIVNNSYYLKSNSQWGTALRIDGALNTFSNNTVYYKVPGGTGIFVNANYALTQADNNNYYWPNADFGSINWSTVTDLPTWQSTLGVDTNSMEVDPQYLSLTDLHTCSPDLYQAGMPFAGLTTDVDGESRSNTPSIGADEFISPSAFTLGPDVTKCEGVTVSIGPGIGGTTYAWNTGDTTSTIGVLFPSTYTVVVTNSCGSGTDNIDVFDTPLPVASFTNSSVYLTGVFTNTSTGGATSYFWDFGDGGTSTDANPMHIFQTSGSHNIMFVATNDCGSDTIYQQIIIAIPSVGENETGLSLQAYPNPSQGVFYVVLNDVDGNGNINITDVQGKQVYSNTFTASGNWNETLDLSHLSKGVYLMNITTDSGRVVERLVID